MKRLVACSYVFVFCCLAAFLPESGLCQVLKAQTCLPDGIRFSSQAALDAFSTDYPGCTMILGSVLIEESVTGDIKNLNGLSTVNRVGRNLEISDNYSLESLTGLDNLLEIGEVLSIAGNQSLLNLEALGQLSQVGQSLRVGSNKALKNLKGLHSIRRISQDLSISDNLTLRNLVGLDSLVRIDGQLSVLSNPSLTNLVGLSSLTSIEGVFEIFDNPLLQSLSALGQLHRVGGDLIIDGNPSLLNLRGLEGVQEVGTFLQIVNNASLSSLNGLLGLRQIGGLLQVYNNMALTNLAGLDSIDYQSIKHLALLSSVNLTNCSVKSICDYLKDPANPASINGNESRCNARQQILAACEGEGINSRPGQNTDILLFPNPSKSLVQIKGRPMSGSNVRVIDTAGRVVLHTFVVNESFQLKDLSAGFYTIHIWDDKRFFYKSILKLD